MVDYRAYPGAITPYPAINQLLQLDERFTLDWVGSRGQTYLFAPRSVQTLSALLFLLKQHKLTYSQALEEPLKDQIYLSVQYLKQIELSSSDVVEVQCGCDLETLHLFLIERGLELGLENLISPKQLVGEAILTGTSCGLILRQQCIQDRLLALELAKPDGGIVQLGVPLAGTVAGPDLHQSIWGIERMEAVLIKAVFRVDPIPPVRLPIIWSFECRRSLWEQFHRLKNFTSTWERLDCLVPRNLSEKAFIIGQISGLEEEMRAFQLSCPAFSVGRETTTLKELLVYFKQQKACFQPYKQSPPTSMEGEYDWQHGLTGGGWNIFINKQPLESHNDADAMPLWKERILACLKSGEGISKNI